MRFTYLKSIFSILFFIWIFSIHSIVFAAQKVTVSTSRAIIYADKELTLPLGYVSMGKELVVGEVTRRGGQILPLIVSGKVAYIKVDDISFSKNDQKKGHSRYFQKDEDPIDFDSLKKVQKDLQKNNYLTTSYGFFEPGDNWHTLASTTGSLAKESIKTISLTLEHRDPLKKLSFGLGLELYTLTQESLKTLSLNLEIPFYYNFYKIKKISLDGLLGISLSSSVKVKILDQTGYYKGFQYGGFFGLRTRMPLTTKWGSFFTISYKMLNINSMKPIKRRDLTDYKVSLFSGTHFTFGAEYRF